MRPENPKPTTCAPAPNFLAAGIGYDPNDSVDVAAAAALSAEWQPLQDSIVLSPAKLFYQNDQVSYQAVQKAAWNFDNGYSLLRIYRSLKVTPQPNNAQNFPAVLKTATAQAQADTITLQGIVTKYTGASN